MRGTQFSTKTKTKKVGMMMCIDIGEFRDRDLTTLLCYFRNRLRRVATSERETMKISIPMTNCHVAPWLHTYSKPLYILWCEINETSADPLPKLSEAQPSESDLSMGY